jgi:hypothetical protein
MWALPWQLHDKGIIGMNRRNIRYIARYNDRRRYPLVDDKLQTKLLAATHGITSPKLIGTVRSQFEVNGSRRWSTSTPASRSSPPKAVAARAFW